VLGDTSLKLFVGVGDPVAFGDVGPHGFKAADVFVFVEVGQDVVLLDVEDQVGEGAKSVLQFGQAALEMLAHEVMSADEGDFSGHGPDLLASGLREGEWEFFVGGEGPLVEEGFPFGEVVGPAQDGVEHGQGVDPRAGDVDEDPGGGWGEEVEDGDVEGPGQGD
jgi:hypothetical protein